MKRNWRRRIMIQVTAVETVQMDAGRCNVTFSRPVTVRAPGAAEANFQVDDGAGNFQAPDGYAQQSANVVTFIFPIFFSVFAGSAWRITGPLVTSLIEGHEVGTRQTGTVVDSGLGGQPPP